MMANFLDGILVVPLRIALKKNHPANDLNNRGTLNLSKLTAMARQEIKVTL
jgi:hypothetical protein